MAHLLWNLNRRYVRAFFESRTLWSNPKYLTDCLSSIPSPSQILELSSNFHHRPPNIYSTLRLSNVSSSSDIWRLSNHWQSYHYSQNLWWGLAQNWPWDHLLVNLLLFKPPSSFLMMLLLFMEHLETTIKAFFSDLGHCFYAIRERRLFNTCFSMYIVDI